MRTFMCAYSSLQLLVLLPGVYTWMSTLAVPFLKRTTLASISMAEHALMPHVCSPLAPARVTSSARS